MRSLSRNNALDTFEIPPFCDNNRKCTGSFNTKPSQVSLNETASNSRNERNQGCNKRGKAITEQRASSTSARPKTYKGLSQKKKTTKKKILLLNILALLHENKHV